ncbi:MAG: hypothetical protein KKF56_00200 [Nanoarchaeota archaeon]|nr:hypothetical protein [Nanoarchaeota archaeon]
MKGNTTYSPINGRFVSIARHDAGDLTEQAAKNADNANGTHDPSAVLILEQNSGEGVGNFEPVPVDKGVRDFLGMRI